MLRSEFLRDAGVPPVLHRYLPSNTAAVRTDAIDIAVEDGTLTLSGTRSFQMVDEVEGYHRKELAEGTFKRTLFLPDSADIDAIEAKSTDGVLEITVPTKAEALPKKVTVEVT